MAFAYAVFAQFLSLVATLLEKKICLHGGVVPTKCWVCLGKKTTTTSFGGLTKEHREFTNNFVDWRIPEEALMRMAHSGAKDCVLQRQRPLHPEPRGQGIKPSKDAKDMWNHPWANHIHYSPLISWLFLVISPCLLSKSQPQCCWRSPGVLCWQNIDPLAI